MCAAIQTYITSQMSYVTEFKTTGTWQYVTFTVPPMTTAQGILTSDNFLLAISSLSTSFLTPASNVNTWQSGVNTLGTYGMYQWWKTAGNYIEFTGVQLEKGTVATPFEQRPFATELALCQRYYYQWSSAISGNYGTFDFGVQNGSNQVHFIVKYPVTMRSNVNSTANFTNSALSTFQFNSGGGAPGTLNSITFDTAASTPYTGRFYITTGSAGTAGLSIELRANNTTSAFLGFNAEL